MHICLANHVRVIQNIFHGRYLIRMVGNVNVIQEFYDTTAQFKFTTIRFQLYQPDRVIRLNLSVDYDFTDQLLIDTHELFIEM